MPCGRIFCLKISNNHYQSSFSLLLFRLLKFISVFLKPNKSDDHCPNMNEMKSIVWPMSKKNWLISWKRCQFQVLIMPLVQLQQQQQRKVQRQRRQWQPLMLQQQHQQQQLLHRIHEKLRKKQTNIKIKQRIQILPYCYY